MPDHGYAWTLYMSDPDNTARNAVLIVDDAKTEDEARHAAEICAASLGMELDFDRRAFHDRVQVKVSERGIPDGLVPADDAAFPRTGFETPLFATPVQNCVYVTDQERRVLARSLEVVELMGDVIAEMLGDPPIHKPTIEALRNKIGPTR